MALTDFFDKINIIDEFDIEAETIDIINKNGEYIEHLVKNQLRKGLSGDGELTRAKHGSYYTDRTIQDKTYNGQGFGKFTDYVTMFMSGRFYTSLRTVASGDMFEVISNVDYFNKLNSWNDGKLIELNAESLKILSEEIIIPELQLRFNSRFNGI